MVVVGGGGSGGGGSGSGGGVGSGGGSRGVGVVVRGGGGNGDGGVFIGNAPWAGGRAGRETKKTGRLGVPPRQCPTAPRSRSVRPSSAPAVHRTSS